MHELSIACELVDLAEKAARAQQAYAVVAVRLELGALAGVEVDALQTGFAAATQGTLLQGARLDVIDMPVRGWCPRCDCEQPAIDLQWLACAFCETPFDFLVSGREIEITALEIALHEDMLVPAP